MSTDAACLEVVSPGLATTVQDSGRRGWQRFGVPVSGAIDPAALAAANIVVGNEPGEAAIECLYRGCELRARTGSARIAVAGEGAALEIITATGDIARHCPALESTTLLPGQRARVRMSGPSISAYLAIEGGLNLPEVLGSRATFTRARFGGYRGRALRAGDVIDLLKPVAERRAEMFLSGLRLLPPSRVRVVRGPQDDHFRQDAWSILTTSRYGVTNASDRMGLRLDGPRLAHTDGADIVSDGIPPGAIQVPADGLPIVMLADRQTTGGYTKIATVVSADLPGLGRLAPGATILFEETSVEQAETLARAHAHDIATWRNRLREVRRLTFGVSALLEANLVSGVIDAHETELTPP